MVCQIKCLNAMHCQYSPMTFDAPKTVIFIDSSSFDHVSDVFSAAAHILSYYFFLLKGTCGPRGQFVDYYFIRLNNMCVFSLWYAYSLRKHVHVINTAIFHGCRKDNFLMKNSDVFLIFAQNIDCGYMLEPPQ